ncbi:hypothetical protein AK812_SmicGene28333 [Symbiodinium microadriaticum]|uniref:Uncharacterized protein n=1 Tax=Symbiodinium microadriaticum TaxID=2951 RepID=A0A1Q9D4J9_SYMMI|nr:hypothetical protein AK812_SmicGene28333 [Symbiodinium microadriaticum]
MFVDAFGAPAAASPVARKVDKVLVVCNNAFRQSSSKLRAMVPQPAMDTDRGYLTSEQVCSGLEVENVSVCGSSFRILRRRTDFFAAVAGDLPLSSTGLVLWESAVLLAEYLGYGGFLSCGLDRSETTAHAKPVKWWLTHPPAAVVPSRFWRSQTRPVLELGGGAGLVTAALATLGAYMVYTDGDLAAIETATLNCRNAQARHGRMRKRRRRSKEKDDREEMLGGGSCVFRQYGDKAPPWPLLDTLCALAEAQQKFCVEPFLVTLAIKNRCCDEVEAFVAAAEQRQRWEIHVADASTLPESFQRAAEGFYGCQDKAAYCIVHLRAAGSYRSPEPREVVPVE